MSTKNPKSGTAADRSQDAPSPEKPRPAGLQSTSGASRSAASSGDFAPAHPGPPHKELLPRVLLAIVVIVGAAGGYVWYRNAHAPKDESRLVLQGNIDVRQVNLAFKVDGRIETLNVDEGDEASAGQVLATLDKPYFKDDLQLARGHRDSAAATLARLEKGSRPEEIAEAQAQVSEKQATLARAKRDYVRAEELVGQGAVSQTDFDRAKSVFSEATVQLAYAEQALRLAELGPRQEDIDGARAQLEAQDAQVVQAERRMTDSQLIAPSPGTILTRAREKGAIVAPGETVFTLTLASPVWVRTYVNERDLGRIHPGMAAEVRTDSAPGKIYHGTIGFISPTAEFTPKTVETRELRTDLVYRLRVIVENPDGGLRQGMPVTVSLELDGPNGAQGN